MKNAVEKTKVLLSGWCCDELKEVAQNWLDSIGTDKEKEAGEKYGNWISVALHRRRVNRAA